MLTIYSWKKLWENWCKSHFQAGWVSVVSATASECRNLSGNPIFCFKLPCMKKWGSYVDKLGSLPYDVKYKACELCVFVTVLLSMGLLFYLFKLVAGPRSAIPEIELSFPEQTNYPPKQCLCVSNGAGANTSLLFPCLCMICVEDDIAEPGMAFIC